MFEWVERKEEKVVRGEKACVCNSEGVQGEGERVWVRGEGSSKQKAFHRHHCPFHH
jgi:hypothetical protein